MPTSLIMYNRTRKKLSNIVVVFHLKFVSLIVLCGNVLPNKQSSHREGYVRGQQLQEEDEEEEEVEDEDEEYGEDFNDNFVVDYENVDRRTLIKELVNASNALGNESTAAATNLFCFLL